MKNLFNFYRLVPAWGLLITAVLSPQALSGQSHPNADIPAGLWTEQTESQLTSNLPRHIHPQTYRALQLDFEGMHSLLNPEAGFSKTISIPLPKGGFEDFQIRPARVMAAGLQQKFPDIRLFEGHSLARPGRLLRMDITLAGFHAMILDPKGSIYLDPVYQDRQDVYQVYYKADYVTDKGFEEGEMVTDQALKQGESGLPSGGTTPVLIPNGQFLRTYRIAIAATGEYSQFHGGTVPLAMSAIATTLNRVVGIYERDLAIRMELIANNDQIVYLNGATDPYSNNDPNAMFTENRTNLTNVIGNNNYDIGHVFSTGGGGLASPRCVCRSNSTFNHKAFGVTGISSPIGDPYDVDYVTHEIGHQFGADHTFNGNVGSCFGNRESTSAFEPGSGSTIMGYAGICGSHDLQNNSHDYFHSRSYEQIITNVTNGPGSQCPASSPTGNTPPQITPPSGNYTIPIETPFELIGDATDLDQDSLTYCWEQYDLGPAGHPSNPNGNAPLFRSHPPSPDSVRTFPYIDDLLNNTTSFGEMLPDYTRSMRFRLTVRDNRFGGGGADFVNTNNIQVSDQAGPFVVAYPNGGEILDVNSIVNIFWDKSNTDLAPVNCQFVDVYLSVDGGYTWPYLLQQAAPNTGVTQILVPDTLTNNARIKIKGVNNIFFDISNSEFTIDELNTGIGDLSAPLEVNLYPNPATDQLFIDIFPEKTLDLRLEIFDVAGQAMITYEEKVTANQHSQLELSVKEFPAGMYLYQLRGEGVFKSGKLVKK